MVLGRDAGSTGASTFAKIMVLPTTSRAPAAAALPPPPRSPSPQFREPEPEVEEDQPASTLSPDFRRRVPNRTLPSAGPQISEDGDDVSPPEEDDGEEEPPPPPSPGNPFGVVPGGARPGTISAPPPRGVPGENEGIEQTPR
jgi:hypothetical protein